MENFVRNSKLNIEKEIKRIEQQPIAPLERIKQIIDVIQTSLTLLKRAVAEYQFQNPEEEIQFFKVWKPQISGLLMFYIRLYQIEKNRVGKSLSAQCKYLKMELENIQKSFLNNSFYDYYRAGQTELDNHYFIRENYDILSDVHCHLLDRDPSFTTLHDSSVAMILANSHLIEYVSDEIDSLSDKLHLKFTSIVDSKLLQWTDSKVALVEFIYAIYAGKCFNNGNTSLKDIAFCCEVLFHQNGLKKFHGFVSIYKPRPDLLIFYRGGGYNKVRKVSRQQNRKISKSVERLRRKAKGPVIWQPAARYSLRVR